MEPSWFWKFVTWQFSTIFQNRNWEHQVENRQIHQSLKIWSFFPITTCWLIRWGVVLILQSIKGIFFCFLLSLRDRNHKHFSLDFSIFLLVDDRIIVWRRLFGSWVWLVRNLIKLDDLSTVSQWWVRLHHL